MTAAILCLGCQPSPNPKSSARTVASVRSTHSTPSPEEIQAASGCKERLHDISGMLLLYNDLNHRLPQSLQDLRDIPGVTLGDLTCPGSKQPYVYNASGIPTPSGAGVVILYDPAPSHSGLRFCISLKDSSRGGAAVTNVIALPEEFFKGR